MKKAIYFFIVLLMGGCSASVTNDQKIIERLQTEGKPYFRELVDSQEYDLLLDRMAKGDEFLIRSSPVFVKWGADASTYLGLTFSLSRAIVHNPDPVMDLIPEYFPENQLCRIPYIEETTETALNHVNGSLSSLKGSKNFSESHAKCIKIYEELKSYIMNRCRESSDCKAVE